VAAPMARRGGLRTVKGMQKTTKRLVAGGVVLGIGAVAVTTFGGSDTSDTPLRTAQVERVTLRSVTTGTGTVQPIRQAALNFAGTGRVATVDVKAGDRVTVGQILMTLDATAAQLDVDAKEAALREATARLDSLRTQVTPSDRANASAAASQASSATQQAQTSEREIDAVTEASERQAASALETAKRQAERDQAQLALDTSRLTEAQERFNSDTTARDAARATLDTAKATQSGALARRNEVRDILNSARQEVARRVTVRDAAQRVLDTATADYERLRALNPSVPDTSGAVPAFVTVSDRDVVRARTALQNASADVAAAEAEVTRLTAIAEGGTDIVTSAERELSTAQARFDTADGRAQASQSNLDAVKQRFEASKEAAAKSADQVANTERSTAADRRRNSQSRVAARQQVRTAKDNERVVETQNAQRVRGARPAEIAAAEAAVDGATAALKSSQDARAKLSLTAPFDGVVGSVGARAGEQIGTSASAIGTSSTSATLAAITLIDDSRYVIRLPLPEVDAARVPSAATATVRFESLGAAAQPIEASVEAVEPTPQVVNGVSTYTARVSLNKPPKAIRVGMTASIEVLLGIRTDVVTVPAEALSEQDGSTIVRTILRSNTDGESTDTANTSKKQTKPVVRTVRVGERADGRVEIIDGVTAGDTVVLPEITGTVR
jgi:HlyD family secretion protein